MLSSVQERSVIIRVFVNPEATSEFMSGRVSEPRSLNHNETDQVVPSVVWVRTGSVLRN